jgi:hypothetical protein
MTLLEDPAANAARVRELHDYMQREMVTGGPAGEAFLAGLERLAGILEAAASGG